MDEPLIACVVLNWNGWLDTIECLESVLRSTYANFSVIVCDNGSADGSLERLLEWADGLLEISTSPRESVNGWRYRAVPKPLRYVVFDSVEAAFAKPAHDARIVFIQNGANLGYAGGNNVGVRYALDRFRADFVWILNNDTVVDRATMGRLASFIGERPQTGILGARLLKYHAPGRIQALGGGTFAPFGARDTQIGRGRRTHARIDDPIDLEHVVGASMLVRAQAIRDVGLLDESYFLYREETDWCIRMRGRGWRLTYCPIAVVWHKEGHASGFKTMLYDYYAVRNMLFLIERFYPKAVPFAFAASLARAVLPKLARLQFRRLALSLRAYVDFLKGVRGMSEVNPDEYVKSRPRTPDPGYDRVAALPPTA